MLDLPVVWFALLVVLLTGYAILDGFDLGAGAVHLIVARTDTERRHVLNSVGPVWDGNEVWLITGGGALFAAFPLVYATVFSGFYLAMVLVLASLILRAVAIEYRSKEASVWWRRGWDVVFSLSSAVAALLFGVAMGNLIGGIALDEQGIYRGGLAGLLNPFGLLTGALALAAAVMQGTAWLVLKTEGAIAERSRRIQFGAIGAVAALWVVLAAMAWSDSGPAVANYKATMAAWIGPLIGVNALLFGLRSTLLRQALRSFLLCSAAVAGLALAAAAALYPNLVPATVTERSLTVGNAHSSELTLTVMLVVALIGMPLVLAYTGFVYWKLRGKVRLESDGY
jgi:cytochrome bd ubiquinol oxidase subunit II